MVKSTYKSQKYVVSNVNMTLLFNVYKLNESIDISFETILFSKKFSTFRDRSTSKHIAQFPHLFHQVLLDCKIQFS